MELFLRKKEKEMEHKSELHSSNIGVRVTDSTKERLNRFAQMEYLPLSSLLRRAIREELQKLSQKYEPDRPTAWAINTDKRC